MHVGGEVPSAQTIQKEVPDSRSVCPVLRFDWVTARSHHTPKKFWMRWKTTRKQDLVDVVETFSPPRTTPVASRMGFVAGQALDSRTGWDFRLLRHKEAAFRYVRKVRPKLVIGSPGCTVFSKLRNLCGSHWDRRRRDRLEEAQNHMRFIVEVHWEQVNHGRWFLHEHPVVATSWLMEEVKKLQRAAGVCTTVADQGGAGSMPARKRTKVMTNSSEIAKELSWKCPEDHLHQALVGGRAHKAAIYSEGLCEAHLYGPQEGNQAIQNEC